MKHTFFMEKALKEAEKTHPLGEVPIGCVIELNGKIIAKGYNQRNTKKNVLCHAEIIAINKACEKLKDWRLEGATLYVTVEPCAMCSGAILQSRIKRVVFGAKNLKGGCCGSILNILNEEKFNHQVEIIGGILEDECKNLIQNFFKELRFKNN